MRTVATGNERSPNVVRRVTGTTSVDNEDDRRRRRGLAGRPSLAVDCGRVGRLTAVHALVNEYTELEPYPLRHSQISTVRNMINC